MTASARGTAGFEGRRWKAVRLGLCLANNHLGGVAMACFYAVWGLVGVLLCLVLIPVALLGKIDAFKAMLSAAALYGLVWPMALMAGATWTMKLVSRILWCGLPRPATATALAVVAVAGRLVVFFAMGDACFGATPLIKGLLRPEILVCSGIACLGLAAEWAFVRTLRRHYLAELAPGGDEPDDAVGDEAEGEAATRRKKNPVFARDVGGWLKERFPRTSRIVVWILLPVAYVIVSSLAADGSLHAVPEAILRLAALTPAFLQIFWVPCATMGHLILAVSPRTAPQSARATGCVR